MKAAADYNLAIIISWEIGEGKLRNKINSNNNNNNNNNNNTRKSQ
jgi:hypothetical protein